MFVTDRSERANLECWTAIRPEDRMSIAVLITSKYIAVALGEKEIRDMADMLECDCRDTNCPARGARKTLLGFLAKEAPSAIAHVN